MSNRLFSDYRILIIDDTEEACVTLQEMLSILGFNAEIALDGWRGWKQMEEMLPDLLFLDINMPRIDGFAFLDKMKGTVYENIPVIMTTSMNSPYEVKKAIQKGAKEYLVKPVEIKRVKEKLILVLNIAF